MKRIPSIRVYALAVCFVSILCAAITAGFALYNLVTLAAPSLTIEPSRIDYYRSNAVFTSTPGPYFPRMPIPQAINESGTSQALAMQNPFADMSEAEITALRQERLQTELDNHSSRARLSLLRQGIIILISSILFFVHWRLAKNIGAGQPNDEGD